MKRLTLVFLVPLLIMSSVVHGKTRNTYYSDAEITVIRERAKLPEYRSAVNGILTRAAQIADLSDEEIWELIPPADLPRALNVRFEVGCPIHGKEVFKKAGHYPWIMSSDKPFKVQCPVGGEIYPTNDFAAYLKNRRTEKLDTTEKYVDDGFGWVDENGDRYWFAGHYTFWHLWRKVILGGSTACAEAYLITGDPKYAHKAAVALARISQVYPDMDYKTQAYHNGRWPADINGRILDYIWENSTVSNFARVYDIIFNTLDENHELPEFIATRGVSDFKHAVEQNILQVAVRDLLAKKIWGNKFELGSLSTIALVLDNHDPARGVTTPEMIDWILRGDGELEFTFYNGIDRDGIGGESAPGYSQIWNVRMVHAAENLARMGVSIVNQPKWRRIAKGPSEMRILDNLSPRLGDCSGTILGAPRLIALDLLRFGVQHFEDPDCARLLIEHRRAGQALLERETIDEAKLQELASRASFPPAPYTRDMGGYGLAILELNDGAETRSATMYYGSAAASHGHLDRLTMAYHMRGRDLLTDLGYPSHWGPIANHWIRNTPSHYCVLVNEEPQSTKMAGFLTRFADLDGLKLAEAQAASVWRLPLPRMTVPAGSIDAPPPPPREVPRVSDYRRMLALLDTGEKSSLLIDAFFVEGGSAHDYSFHGLPYGAFSIDAKLVREQHTGTLAGENIEYAQDPGDGLAPRGHQFFIQPKWYEPNDVTKLSWRDDDGIDMDAWFPRFSFDEIVVADTIPPIKPGYPESIPYTLLRHRGEDNLVSLFLGIIDVNAGPSPVKNVRRIAANHSKAGGAVIEMHTGGAWRIYVNGADQLVAFDDGAKTDLSFVAVQIPSDKPTRAHLIGAGNFTAPDLPTLAQSAAPQMPVRKVDYRAGVVTVDAQNLELGQHGTVVIARTGDHSASYTVRETRATSDGLELTFGDVGLITGRFAGAWDPGRKLLVMTERTGGVYNQFVAKNFVGMTAVNEDFTASATIVEYDAQANTFAIETDDATAARFSDRDNDGRSYVYIADFGPGTTVSTTPASTILLE